MDRDLLVYLDTQGGPLPCGRLRVRSGARQGASFEYDAAWIDHRAGFPIDPELPLFAGQFHTARPVFRAFTDPAPDRWGQTLLRRAERARARREKRTPRTLAAVDFLTLVSDETRLGALRFRDAMVGPSSPFLTSDGAPVPPLVSLPKLLSASTRAVADEDTDEDLALLLAPGTSLGGARPKASVRAADGALLIAKFPRKDDDWPVTRWEATTLALAALSGIRVPRVRLEEVARRPVLILERFDRVGGKRTHFMSAMTAVAADDNDARTYGDIADVIRQLGSRPIDDLRELWRRMVFNVLVSNTDDHLRNHGFLREDTGFRLAPAYDLNPMPIDVRPRVHALALDEDAPESSMETAFAVSAKYGLSLSEAAAVASEVAGAVRKWRLFAKRHGLRPREIDRMASAFEHDDLARAERGP